MSALAPVLQSFFTERLRGQRRASPHTIAGYRDTFRLLLRFAADRTGTQPSRIDIGLIDAPLISAFLDHLDEPGMLMLADRGFASYSLWKAAAGTGAQLCWRMSAKFKLPVLQPLPDGTHLSQLRPKRKRDGDPITVRVVKYTVTTTDVDTGEQTCESFTLATTLLDPDAYPAMELAVHYHDRWQAETGIADLKTTMRGGPEVVCAPRHRR